MPGHLVISLDFELHWGVHDRLDVDDYRANLTGARAVIPKILGLFEAYGIRATWATVGFLFAETRSELQDYCPSVLPRYKDGRLSPYGLLAEIGNGELDDPFHYAPTLLKKIAESPGQEVGTHTFSHFYALEPTRSAAAFLADLEAAQSLGRAKGRELVSVVFPRNQIPRDYLDACAEHGIIAYRGTESAFFQNPSPAVFNQAWRRLLRLVDAYLPLGSHHLSRPGEAGIERPLNVPASRFLRPYSPWLFLLEPLRLRRITGAMTAAAQTGSCFHLWWHPHNFGVNPEKNLRFLERVLQHFLLLREHNDMVSLSMRDVAAQHASRNEVSR